MALSSGTRLGPYEIVSLIAAGGMGEVYKARDTRLDRTVAIKVSQEQFTERFDREARAVAALNHPHICTLHDVGPNYLVMEYIEGPTLGERIAGGAIALHEALPIARQIAEALEAAHEKGVVHRDLKPANIKLTSDGKVKVLDFGLAKAFETASFVGDPLSSPTLTLSATRAGMILGTAAYMSPEQARGLAADRRADIWAYGVVLFEILAGRQMFAGETVSDTLASVLKTDPDWSALPPETPPAIQRLLRRCVDRDRQRRLPDIGVARLEIDEALSDSGDVTTAVTGSNRLAKTRLPSIVAGAFAMVAAVALWMTWHGVRTVEPTPQPLVRLEVDLGNDVSLGPSPGTDAILSPDGSRLVYLSRSRLFTRRLDQPNATELAGTEGAYDQFFSPDGQWVAFLQARALKKISVQGGSAITLCNGVTGFGGTWAGDGHIITVFGAGVLSRIPSAGGAPTPLTELAPGEVAHRWPQVLPGDRAVLFTAYKSTAGLDGANIEVISLGDGRRKTLHRGGTYGRYLPSGHLVYLSGGTLFAAPFDLERLELRGAPSPILPEVGWKTSSGAAQFDFSRNGTVVYQTGGTRTSPVTLQWLDRTDKMQPLLGKPGDYRLGQLSADGNRLALESAGDIWVYEWQRDIMRRLTFGGGGRHPIWSPNGRYIAFQGTGGMFWIQADGAVNPQTLTQTKNRHVPGSFTPDGRRLVFAEDNPETGFDIWTVAVESDGAGLRAGKPEVFLRTSFDEGQPTLSPDGRWLAYDSDESGTFQVYVRAFPDKGGKWQISNGGGRNPVWSRNGRDLFFRTMDNQIMVTAYTVQGDSLLVEKPRPWSEKKLANVGFRRNFDVAPDGKRIAVLMPAESLAAQKAQSHVIFLLNFFDELRRRVPTGR
jgi:serine/threonine-protein kinase